MANSPRITPLRHRAHALIAAPRAAPPPRSNALAIAAQTRGFRAL
jgi:hypothetical protein